MSGVDRFNVLLGAVRRLPNPDGPNRESIMLCRAPLTAFLFCFGFEQIELFTSKFSCGAGEGNDSEKVCILSAGCYFPAR